MRVLGVDFTSAPGRRKAITVASGRLRGATLSVDSLDRIESFAGFAALLARPGPWIGGFDFPFGLPREAVEALRWPETWPKLVKHCETLGRKGFTRASDELRVSRPKGRKYPKRLGDDAAKSHSPMKCVRPPVDLLDAAICALQAAWALQRQAMEYGLPAQMDPLEGWIVTVPRI